MSTSPDFGLRLPRERELARDTKLASGLNLAAGLWLLASPLVFEYGDAARWNALATGAAIALLAGARATDVRRPPALSWANVLLGVWLVGSPFALDSGAAAMWNFLAVGTWIGFWALVSATSNPRIWKRAPH